MADITTPEVYYTQTVPEQYNGTVPNAAAGHPELTVIYDIDGEQYGLRAAEGTIEVVPAEEIAAPDMRIVLSHDDWATFARSGSTDPFVDYIARDKTAIVKGLKGTVNLELTRSGGELWRSSTVFNGQEEPAVTLIMSDDDYRAMLNGDLNGQMAFLTGKMKFEGSLPLLMQVGALTA